MSEETTDEPVIRKPLPGQRPLFDLELTLFGPMERERRTGRPISRRCTAARSGTGPEGETCRTCRHFVRLQYRNGLYFKCGKVKHLWTHGEATDIRAGWAACSEWEEIVPDD